MEPIIQTLENLTISPLYKLGKFLRNEMFILVEF